MQSSLTKRLIKIMIAVLFGITALKILLVGYDIDEQYAITMSYRLLQGDFPLLDMWEPHQTSGFVGALLMAPYLAVAGSTTGIVLYLRICGLGLHCLVTFLLYRQLSRFQTEICSSLLCCIYFFSLPKLMFLPEFSNLQLWFLMGMIFCLLCYYTPVGAFATASSHSLFLLTAAGILLTLEVLTYPSTLLVFPICIYFIIHYRGKHPLIKELLAFVSPCILGAAAFICWLLSQISISQLPALIKAVAGDGSHSASLSDRFLTNVRSLGEILCFLAIYGLLALLLYFLFRKKKDLSLLWCRLLLVCTLIGQLFIWILGNRYPNYPLVEYFFVPCICIAVSRYRKKTRNPLFSFFVIVPLTAFLGIVLFTNHPLLVSAPFLIPCVIGSLSLIDYSAEKTGLLSMRSLLLLWVMVLLFGKCYLVRTTGGMHYLLTDSVSIMREGPAAGILADSDTVQRYRASLDFITENLPKEAKVFYAGCSSDVYLMQNMAFCTPSTISSPTFDEKVMEYFTLHPDKLPDYILCDSDLPDLYNGGWFSSFLTDYCEATPSAQNDYLVLYVKK